MSNEINVGAISEALNYKADLDGNNVAGTGFEDYIKSLTGSGSGGSNAFPSNNKVSLSVGATGSTYTAPANGWFALNSNSSFGSTEMKTPPSFYMENITVGGFGISGYGQYISTYKSSGILPVKKDDVIKLQYYSANGITLYLNFVYAQGEQ